MGIRWTHLVALCLYMWVGSRLIEADQFADFFLCNGTCAGPSDLIKDHLTGGLWVVDSPNNRVLLYSYSIWRLNASDPSPLPVGVLGQPDLNSVSAGNGSAKLNGPLGIHVTTYGRLYVADTNNNRVLFWDAASSKPNGAPADGVIGQPDFFTITPGSGPAKMNQPTSVSGVLTSIWVADMGNNRVLRFNKTALAFSNGVPDGILGQQDYVSSAPGLSATQFNSPFYVRLAKTNFLFVSDMGNNRVLAFDPATLISANGGPAAYVFMQPNFASNGTSPVSSTSGYAPKGIAFNTEYHTDLYIVDSGNYRLLLYADGQSPTMNDQPAVSALGQPDYTSRSAGLALNKLLQPIGGLYYAATNSLWIADYGAGRVARFPNVFLGSELYNATQEVQVNFQGRSPSASLVPAALNASDPFYNLQIIPSSLNEIGTGGRQIPLPPTGYSAITSIDDANTEQFAFILDAPGTVITFEYLLYANSTMLNASSVSFVANNGSVKFSVSIIGWNWTNPSNTLDLVCTLSIQPAVTSSVTAFTSNELSGYILQSSGSPYVTSVELLHFATLDGIDTPITFDLNATTLVFHFPHFDSSLYYDPNFSVVVGGVSSGGDGGQSDHLLPLLALLALPIPVVLVMAALAGVATVWVFRRLRMRPLQTAVNF